MVSVLVLVRRYARRSECARLEKSTSLDIYLMRENLFEDQMDFHKNWFYLMEMTT